MKLQKTSISHCIPGDRPGLQDKKGNLYYVDGFQVIERDYEQIMKGDLLRLKMISGTENLELSFMELNANARYLSWVFIVLVTVS